MTKQLIYFFFSFFLFIPITLLKADTLCILQNRIKQIDNFYACFVQNISNSDGTIIESGKGKLWIKKPNLFHLHIIKPEEIHLISDGITLWFYTPTIKQVTAYCLKKNIINNIFLKLLCNDDISEYKKYSITQHQDWFYLKPILNNDLNLKEFKININNCGIINQFAIAESNNQYIGYNLSNQNTYPININQFSFIIPKDVLFDDQR